MSRHSQIESRSAFHTASSVVSDEANHLSSPKAFTGAYDIELPKGADEYETEDGQIVKQQIDPAPASSINPYFNVRIKTVNGTNYPLTDEESATSKIHDNVTARDLISNPRGASIYNADDFLYMKHFGKMPMNRLITLRRFAFPIFDDIFSKTSQPEPDIARLLTFFDQENNKLSDIMSFTFGLDWKELKSESEQASMQGDQNGVDGIVGKALKFIDPKYGKESLAGSNKVNFDPQHDSNRVYGPVDSIASAHIREVGLKFTQEMQLTFDFEIKSINGVNQKAAFIDLLANIILLCTNDGKFWGGARYWVGPKPTKYLNDLKALSPTSFDDFVNKSTASMKQMLGSFATKSSAKETLKNIANNAMNLALGKMLDKLGRPGIPMMNSLLTGTPVGPWHLTIGNPLNPIMVAGDLIIDNAALSFGDELGYDDFPTEMKLTLTLKHNKPRGRAEIESMFNAGKSRLYFKPKDVFNRHNANGAIKAASQQEPATTSSDKSNNGLGGVKFPGYDKADVMKNQNEVWSFLQQNKQ